MNHFRFLCVLLLTLTSTALWAQDGANERKIVTSTFTHLSGYYDSELYTAGTFSTVEGHDYGFVGPNRPSWARFKNETIEGEACMAVSLDPSYSFKLTSRFIIDGYVKRIIVRAGGNLGGIGVVFNEYPMVRVTKPTSGIEEYVLDYGDEHLTLPDKNLTVEFRLEEQTQEKPIYIQSITVEFEEIPEISYEGITSTFTSFDSDSHTLKATASAFDWTMDWPTDGTTIEATSVTMADENAVYVRINGGTSTYKRLDFTPKFPITSKVKKIVVHAGGEIDMIYFANERYDIMERIPVGNDTFKDWILDFGEGGIDISGNFQFSIFAKSVFYIQSITLVTDAPLTDGVTSTFSNWIELTSSESRKTGRMLTEEQNDWDGIINKPDVQMEYTRIGGVNYEDGTSCLVAWGQNSEFTLNMISQFDYSGPVQKIIVRASGNVNQIAATIKEKNGGSGQAVAHIDASTTDDFYDYVLHFQETPSYESADIQLQIFGSSPIFIHSVTIVKEEHQEALPKGKCGDNLQYELVYIEGETTYNRDTNTEIPAMKLVITGSGDMYDYDSDWPDEPNSTPWANYRYNITSVELTDQMTHAGSYAFSRLWNNNFKELPSGLKSVGAMAFYNDFFLEELRLPEGLETIDYSGFNALNGAKKVYVGPKLQSIANQGLNGLYSVQYYFVDEKNPTYRGDGYGIIERSTNTLIAGGKFTEIPEGITSIGHNAFSNTRKETVKLPKSLKEIGNYAFYYSQLKEITITDSVKKIGQNAFGSCKQLLSVTIGKDVISIKKGAFDYSNNILDVYCYANPDQLEWESSSFETRSFMPDQMTKMHVREADLDKWKAKFSVLNVTFVGDLGQAIVPITNETTVNAETLKGEDLTDNTIENIYYNLDESKGCGYIDNSLIIGQVTDMSKIGNGEPGSEEVRDNFNGIILKVNGKGTITIDSRVFGSKIRLAVRIGEGTPTYASENSRWQTYVTYNVTEETYVYIYAVGPGSLLRAQDNRAPEVGDDALVIYGITVTPDDAEAINDIELGSNNDNQWYDINGRAVAAPKSKGIYIRNGKKVMVK